MSDGSNDGGMKEKKKRKNGEKNDFDGEIEQNILK